MTADFYLAHCCADGIPMWDTGAPNLHRLPSNYLNQPADPFNKFEPVDSSAAAIAAPAAASRVSAPDADSPSNAPSAASPTAVELWLKNARRFRAQRRS